MAVFRKIYIRRLVAGLLAVLIVLMNFMPFVAFAEGNFNPGNFNPGDFNPGDFNPGDFNPGDFNPGDFSPGEFSPGDFNPGDFSPGDFNPGDFNPGQFSPNDISPSNPNNKENNSQTPSNDSQSNENKNDNNLNKGNKSENSSGSDATTENESENHSKENGDGSNNDHSNSPYLKNDSKLDDWKYYLGKIGGISFTSASGYLAYQNGHRLLQVIDGPTGKTTNFLVTGTNKNVLPANAPWHKRLVTNPIHNFLTEIGRNGKKIKSDAVKKTLGLFGGKKEARVLPVNNHYVNPGAAFKNSLTKSGGWIINGGIATYAAYKEHGFGNSDFAATAITETVFGVGAAAAGSAIGAMAAGAAVGTAIPIPLVGTIVGAVAGGVIGILLETPVGRKVKDFVRTGVKKGIDKVTSLAKKGWKAVKGWFK